MDRLDNLVRFHQTALGLRSARQEVLASNIANADTPDYKARDIDFKAALKSAMDNEPGQQLPMATTSDRHLQPLPRNATGPFGAELLYRNPVQPSADGNTVEMDVERAKFADNAVNYQASVRFVSSKFSGVMSALRSQ